MSQIFLPNLSVVLGAAASGKSHFAELLLARSGHSPVYIATAQAYDAEMEAKIAAHRNERGAGWRTIEAPLDLPGALAGLRRNEAALIDCATMWLSNLMLAGGDRAEAEAGLYAALAECPVPVVVVSNEVGAGIVPESALGRSFREAQGRLNQRLAARADLVVQVVAGLPLVLKGVLP